MLSQWGHHIKRGKTYAKAVKLVYDGGFCCKKREKRLDFHSDQSVRALSSLQVKPPEKRIHSLADVLPRLIWSPLSLPFTKPLAQRNLRLVTSHHHLAH